MALFARNDSLRKMCWIGFLGAPVAAHKTFCRHALYVPLRPDIRILPTFSRLNVISYTNKSRPGVLRQKVKNNVGQSKQNMSGLFTEPSSVWIIKQGGRNTISVWLDPRNTPLCVTCRPWDYNFVTRGTWVFEVHTVSRVSGGPPAATAPRGSRAHTDALQKRAKKVRKLIRP